MVQIGIPLFFLALLRSNRDKMRSKDPFLRNFVEVQLGFLYAGYRDDAWYFELIDMFHKVTPLPASPLRLVRLILNGLCVLLVCVLLLCGVQLTITSMLGLFPQGAQLPVGQTIAIVYMIILLHLNPYIRRDDDRLHLLTQVEVFLYLAAGWLFYNLPVDAYSVQNDLLMSVLLILLFILVGGSFMLFAAYRVYRFFARMYRARQNRRAREAAPEARAKRKNKPKPMSDAGAGAVELAPVVVPPDGKDAKSAEPSPNNDEDNDAKDSKSKSGEGDGDGGSRSGSGSGGEEDGGGADDAAGNSPPKSPLPGQTPAV